MEHYDNSTVRRTDRLLDLPEAEKLLRRGEYGTLSMVEERHGTVAGYGIPISYAWDGNNHIYFHCAPEGHKLRMLDSSPEVTFTVVGTTQVIAEKFTTAYQSILVRGRIHRALPPEERMNALKLLIAKYAPDDQERGDSYAQKSFHRTEILRLGVDSISGKTKRVVP